MLSSGNTQVDQQSSPQNRTESCAIQQCANTCSALCWKLSPLATQQLLALLCFFCVSEDRITLYCHDLLRKTVLLHLARSRLNRSIDVFSGTIQKALGRGARVQVSRTAKTCWSHAGTRSFLFCCQSQGRNQLTIKTQSASKLSNSGPKAGVALCAGFDLNLDNVPHVPEEEEPCANSSSSRYSLSQAGCNSSVSSDRRTKVCLQSLAIPRPLSWTPSAASV